MMNCDDLINRTNSLDQSDHPEPRSSRTDSRLSISSIGEDRLSTSTTYERGGLRQRVTEYLKEQSFGSENVRRGSCPETALLQEQAIHPKEFLCTALHAEPVLVASSDDKIQLEALHIPHEENLDKPYSERKVAIYFGGSHANAFYYAKKQVKWLQDDSHHFDVFVPNRRGFGESGGEPSLTAMGPDAEQVVRHLMAQGYLPENMTVIGYSMGCVEAAHVGEKFPIDTLVIDRGFSKLSDMCRDSAPLGLRTIAKKVSQAINFDVDVGEKLSRFQGKNVQVVRGKKDEMKKHQYKRNMRILRQAMSCRDRPFNLNGIEVSELVHDPIKFDFAKRYGNAQVKLRSDAV